MKNLEHFFKLKGIKRVKHGIVYNLEGLKQIFVWDQDGLEIKILELPDGLKEGIIVFRSSDGSLIPMD